MQPDDDMHPRASVGTVASELADRLLAEESGDFQAIKVPDWPELSHLSQMLSGGSVCIMGGPQNVGKSFWVLSMLRAVIESGHQADYLTLEDNRAEFLKRAIALECGSYRFLNNDTEGATERLDFLASPLGTSIVEKYGPSIHENPRKPRKDADGFMHTPRFDHVDAMEWLAATCSKGSRVAFLDPVTQIDFGAGKDSLKAEESFIRDATALAAQHRVTLVFVMHTKKLFGKPDGFLPGIEDLAGSSLWAKLAHTVVMMCAHEDKESNISAPGSLPGVYTTQPIEHNRTVKIEKTRRGRGARMALAYSQDGDRPAFSEHGLIVRGK